MAFLVKTTTPFVFFANNESVEPLASKIEGFEFVSPNEITVYGNFEVRTQLFAVADAYLKV